MSEEVNHPEANGNSGLVIRQEAQNVILRGLESMLAKIPESQESLAKNPTKRAKEIMHEASIKAGMISAGLALPPGPLGILTVIPDLLQIWRLQQQMVADIAACYGKSASLTQEMMVYCLFRHGAAMFARDLLVRVGERMIMKESSVRLIQQVLQRVSIEVSQKMIGKSVSRWVPLVGPAMIGWYSWHDTKKVAQTAMDTFMRDLSEASDVEVLGEAGG